MYQKNVFVDGTFSADCLHVGSYDEAELAEMDVCDAQCLSLELDALHCLRYFAGVEVLVLRPGQIDPKYLHELYRQPIRTLKLDYDSDSQDEYSMDLSGFACLEAVFSRSQYNLKNAAGCASLKRMTVQAWHSSDLRELQGAGITELRILSGKLKSLSGVAELPGLKKLAVSNQRNLIHFPTRDGELLLEELSIENCNRLSLDEMPGMDSLHTLALCGRQTIPDCGFFARYPNLKRLLLDVKITDGDIAPLLDLEYCVILRDYRHYSLKNEDLPKRGEKIIL